MLASGYARYSNLVILIVVVLGTGLLVFTFLIILVRGFKPGSHVTDANSIRHLRQLLVWMIMTVQVVSQVARASSSELPTLMRTVYSAVALIQLEGIVIAPACLGTYAFESEVGLMGAALLCWTAAIVTYYACQCRCCGSLRIAGKVSMTGALLLAPIAIEKAVVLVNCQFATMTGVAITALDGGDSYGAKISSSTDLVSLPLLSSDPYYVCFAGQHAIAGIMAIVCLVVYAMGLPLLTFIWLRRDPRLRIEVERVRDDVARRRSAASVVPATTSSRGSLWRSLSIKRAASVTWSPPTAMPPQRQRRVSWTSAPGQAQRDPVLAPFLEDSGYGPHAWFFRHLDLCATISLAVLEVCCSMHAVVRLTIIPPVPPSSATSSRALFPIQLRKCFYRLRSRSPSSRSFCSVGLCSFPARTMSVSEFWTGGGRPGISAHLTCYCALLTWQAMGGSCPFERLSSSCLQPARHKTLRYLPSP